METETESELFVGVEADIPICKKSFLWERHQRVKHMWPLTPQGKLQEPQDLNNMHMKWHLLNLPQQVFYNYLTHHGQCWNHFCKQYSMQPCLNSLNHKSTLHMLILYSLYQSILYYTLIYRKAYQMWATCNYCLITVFRQWLWWQGLCLQIGPQPGLVLGSLVYLKESHCVLPLTTSHSLWNMTC